MDHVSADWQAMLAGRYRIESELGRGGMATVYLATDLRHARQVAIKVLDAAIGRSRAGVDRFLREIRTVAGLQHPNILALFDSGEVAGHLYYVMPFVAGQSLRDRLDQGALSPAEVLGIARQVAMALDHAHRSGIVHRDVKPENVLLSGNHALLADFGIARAVDAAREALTETNVAIGTPAYMSPEQATADPTIDGRADQYALGCMVYEMIEGRPPFSGDSSRALLAAQTAASMPPLTRAHGRALEENVLRRALAKDPGLRYPTCTAFIDALERPRRAVGTRIGRIAASIVLLLSVAAAGLWATRRARLSDGDPGAIHTIAVLPFTSSGDSTLAIIAEGLTEGVRTNLTTVPGIGVLSGGTVQATRAGETGSREIGRELNARSVFSASVQLDRTSIRVWWQMVRVSDGAIVASGKLDGELMRDGKLEDVFRIQDAMSEGIVAALRPRLPAPAARRAHRTRDIGAYRLYLEGRRATFAITAASVQRAIELFRGAIERDSLYADAWAGLADAYGFWAQVGSQRIVDVAPLMRSAAERAIELDSANGHAFVIRATVRAYHDWDWEGARRDMRRALLVSPSSADAVFNYAAFLNFVDEADSALYYMHRAVAIDPANAFLRANLAYRYRFAGQFDSAIGAAEQALALDSTQWLASLVLTELYHGKGRRADAAREAERVLRLAGSDAPAPLAWLSSYFALSGQQGRAREMVRQLDELAARGPVPPVYRAQALLAAGDSAGALAAMEASADARDLDLPVELIWHLAIFSGHERYEQVRRRVFGSQRAPRGFPLPT